MTYCQITFAERYTLGLLRQGGLAPAAIARVLGRHRSTISRECARVHRGRGARLQLAEHHVPRLALDQAQEARPPRPEHGVGLPVAHLGPPLHHRRAGGDRSLPRHAPPAVVAPVAFAPLVAGPAQVGVEDPPGGFVRPEVAGNGTPRDGAYRPQLADWYARGRRSRSRRNGRFSGAGGRRS